MIFKNHISEKTVKIPVDKIPPETGWWIEFSPHSEEFSSTALLSGAGSASNLGVIFD